MFGFHDIYFKCPIIIIIFNLFLISARLPWLFVPFHLLNSWLLVRRCIKLYVVVAHQLAGGLSSVSQGGSVSSQPPLATRHGVPERRRRASAEVRYIIVTCSSSRQQKKNTCSSCCCFHSDVSLFRNHKRQERSWENCYQTN